MPSADSVNRLIMPQIPGVTQNSRSLPGHWEPCLKKIGTEIGQTVSKHIHYTRTELIYT